MQRSLTLSRRRQAGDTIVEVLLSIAVIGLVLTAGYATTNRNFSSIREAQEQTDAYKLLEQQVEALKSYSETTAGAAALQQRTPVRSEFCMSVDTTSPTTSPSYGKVSLTTDTVHQCVFGTDGKTTSSSTIPSFTVKITTLSANSNTDPGGHSYQFTAKWDSLLGGQSQAKLYYEVYF